MIFDDKSSYWQWAESHSHSEEGGLKEDVEANPDTLDESKALWSPKPPLSEIDDNNLSAYYRVINDGALQQLSERQREIWKLLFFKRLSVEQVASDLGISVSNVHTHAKRAALRLQGAIEKDKKKRAYLEGRYSKNGFKKNVKQVGKLDAIDKEFGERLMKHEAEIDAFINLHPELRKQI